MSVRRWRAINFFIPERKTWLHDVNPAFKFAVLIVVLMFAFFNRKADVAFYQMVVYLICLYTLSGHHWKKLALITAPFVLVFISSASSLILFGKGDTVWWQWGLIKISEESFHHGLLIGFKTLSFGAVGLLFSLTVKPVQFFYAMMQKLRLPPKYGYSLIASIRLFPMVIDDFQARAHALKIRGMRFSKGVRGAYERVRVYAVPMLAQSIRRAQRVAVAMEAKRFQMGASRTFYYETSFSLADVWFTLVMLALLAVAYVASHQFPLFS